MIGTTNSVAAPDLLLTAFPAHLTSSPLILGLITPLQNATWSLPQIWTIGWLRRNRYALPLYHWSAVLRTISWIALVVVVFLSRNSAVLLTTLMLFVVMGGLAAGVTGLPFTEVVAKVIPARQRGLVFGWRGALGGALAIVGSPVVLFFTGPDVRFEFPINFALLFIIGGFALALLAGLFALVKGGLARWHSVVALLGFAVAILVKEVREGLLGYDIGGMKLDTGLGGKMMFVAAAAGALVALVGLIKPER